MLVPAVPPKEINPSILPSSNSRRTTAAAPSAITAMLLPRSRAETNSSIVCPPALATSSLLTSGANAGVPKTPLSMTIVSTPEDSIRRRRYANSSPFVSSVPRIATVFFIAFLLDREAGRLISYRKRLESLDLFRNRSLCRNSLDAGSTKESGDSAGPSKHIGDIFRLGQRPSVTEHQNVGFNGCGGITDRLDERNSLLE